MAVNRLQVSFILAASIVVVNVVANLLSFYWHTRTPLAVAIVATAVLSFVGLLAIRQSPQGEWKIEEADMRTAIAGTIVIEYLVLVATVAFLPELPNTEGRAETLPALTQTLISNFTYMVGVVIAFYFGASAYVEARKS